MFLAHISDTHLGYAQYSLEDREEDFYEVFREAVDRILEEHVRLVLHSGDFFHSPRPPIKALKVAQDGLRKLRERGIEVVIIPGGHDMLRRRGLPPLILYEHLGVVVLRRRVPFFKKGEVFIGGFEHLPRNYWRSKEPLRILEGIALKASESGAKRRILMLHQGLHPYLPVGYEASVAQLPEGFHYYALGHIHRRVAGEHGRGILAYAGSTEITDISEIRSYSSQGKGFYVVDLSGEAPEVHNVDLRSIRPQTILEERVSRLEHLANRLRLFLGELRVGKKPLIHIRLRGTEINRSELERFVLHPFRERVLKFRILFEPEVEGERVFEAKEVDLRSTFREFFGNEGLAEFAYSIFPLLARGESKEALEEVRRIFQSKSWKAWVK